MVYREICTLISGGGVSGKVNKHGIYSDTSKGLPRSTVFPRFPDGTWAACFKCHARCHNLTFRLVRALGTLRKSALAPTLPEDQRCLKNTPPPPKCHNREQEAQIEHHRGDHRSHLSSCVRNSF